MSGVEKFIGTSMTFWGVAVTFLSAALPAIGPFLGLDVGPGEVGDLGAKGTSLLQALGGFVGAVIAIIGRLRADSPATLNPAKKS